MQDLVKKVGRRVGRKLGLDIRRVSKIAEDEGRYPYIESFHMKEINFDYWITDKVYRSWYEPSAQSSWCINEGYLQFVAPDDKVLEIGCNAGFTTCLLSRAVGPKGFVVGLDIIPSNCLLASAQIGLNGITNARIINRGASSEPGRIWVNNTNNGSVQSSPTQGGIQVEVVRCDDLIATHGYFDVLKIDVEGFESQVLKGAQELMSKRPKLLLEVHGDDVVKYGSSYEELFKLFHAHEYEGVMALDPNSPTATNALEPFDADRVLRSRLHGNLFLRPKRA